MKQTRALAIHPDKKPNEANKSGIRIIPDLFHGPNFFFSFFRSSRLLLVGKRTGGVLGLSNSRVSQPETEEDIFFSCEHLFSRE